MSGRASLYQLSLTLCLYDQTGMRQEKNGLGLERRHGEEKAGMYYLHTRTGALWCGMRCKQRRRTPRQPWWYAYYFMLETHPIGMLLVAVDTRPQARKKNTLVSS